MTIKQIGKKIGINKETLRERFSVKRIGVFGSYARGDYSGQSDVDMLVEFARPIDLFAFIRLENFLSNCLRKRVDLVTRRALKPLIKKDILKETVYL